MSVRSYSSLVHWLQSSFFTNILTEQNGKKSMVFEPNVSVAFIFQKKFLTDRGTGISYVDCPRNPRFFYSHHPPPLSLPLPTTSGPKMSPNRRKGPIWKPITRGPFFIKFANFSTRLRGVGMGGIFMDLQEGRGRGEKEGVLLFRVLYYVVSQLSVRAINLYLGGNRPNIAYITCSTRRLF